MCILIIANTAFTQSPGNNISKIDELIKAGNFDSALLLIEDILFSDPSNIDVQERKINILVKTDRSKEAFKDIDEYLSLYSGSPEYYYLRAILNLQKQKYVKAIDDFDRALNLNIPKSNEYKVYLNRGMAHFYLRDFDLAEDDFRKVMEMNPKNAAAYHGEGMVKYELHEYEEAVTEFQKSLKLEENNPITHFNMAMTYFRLEEKDNACYHFNRSCALGNRNACRLLMLECTEEIKIAR